MLNLIFKDQIALGVGQAIATALLALIVTLLARQQKIHLERETIIALIRGIVQVVLAGVVLLALLNGPKLISIPVLLGMMVVAAIFVARRGKGVPDSFRIAFYGIAIGAGLVIVIMMLVGVIDVAPANAVPVGSMLIAQAMNTSAQALERFQSDVKAHVGLIETGLALGAEPGTMVAPYKQQAVYSSMIPRLDSLSSLGIVWIPGVMAGQILAGQNPIYAGVYQFAVLAMIFASAALSAVVSTILIGAKAFSTAQQLTLRPEVANPTQKINLPRFLQWNKRAEQKK